MLNNTNKCIRYIFIYNIMINFVIILKNIEINYLLIYYITYHEN